jgi:uncharacterized LabA/DUF88 family protein
MGVHSVAPDRVVVFLDYQNVYMGARACFESASAHHTQGQISPLTLGLELVAQSKYPRELAQVRVYRGRPDATRQPAGYAACTRQAAIWAQDPRVECILRTLQYPRGWPTSHASGEAPREKGIDVALAIDFVRMAVTGDYDVGILMSTDTDLKPALETAVALRNSSGLPRVEVAAWSGTDMHNRRLSITQAKLWCHWLDETFYAKVADRTNYSLAP